MFRGHVFGPFGCHGGSRFTASPPPKHDCYLAWISGYANFRLDAVRFHWRCPVTVRENLNPDEAHFIDQDDHVVITRDEPSSALITRSTTSQLVLLVVIVCHRYIQF